MTALAAQEAAPANGGTKSTEAERQGQPTMDERIAAVVAAAPPLSSEQKARLSVLLRGGGAA